jgi:hypothetical protein
MKAVALTIWLTALAPASALAQSSFAELQLSHIHANVPASTNFSSFLKRDLLSYFHNQGLVAATSVSFTLLRDGPTQSGVAYPKFYVWVLVLNGKKVLTQGAARVAAIEQSHFEVTDFLSSSKVRALPEEVSSVFPAPLVSSIVSRAESAQ